MAKYKNNVTLGFINGAKDILKIVKFHQIAIAILKDGSPSCGSTYIYDGSFLGLKKRGKGVTTTLLEQKGVRVFNEKEVHKAIEYLKGINHGK